jgi:hypothetical protein
MKKYILFCLILVLNCIIFAQVPDWQWAVGAGGINTDESYNLAVDSQGNTYIAGFFTGTANFGSTELISAGVTDIFIAKLDTNGNWLWAVRAGGEWMDEADDIAVDEVGNIYVTGYFNDTATFGSTSLTSSGSTDIFVAKLDTDGNWLWVVRGGGFDSDHAYGIAVNTTGVAITGYVTNDVAFGSHPLTGFGYGDIFIAKLDAEGNWLWARNAGSSMYDIGYAVALDNAGNVYATGYFQEDANFAGTILTSLGSYDLFITKLNPDGFMIAAFRAGGIESDVGTGIALDPAGNVYLTGYFNLSIAFGPFVMTSYGGSDIFITKLNSGAIYQWARQAGGTNEDEGLSIAADSQGNVYSTGYFIDSALFGNVTLTGYGEQDAYIAKLDTNGYLSWAVKGGGTGYDYGDGIAVAGTGDIYCTGAFEQTAVFGDDMLTSQGSLDVFVTKLYASNVANDDPFTPEATSNSILHDAYPNPLHPGQAVTIKTVIAKGETGIISIYNLKGQCIKNYALESGTHEISLDSRKLASGIYFYRLKTSSTDITKKLVLNK